MARELVNEIFVDKIQCLVSQLDTLFLKYWGIWIKVNFFLDSRCIPHYIRVMREPWKPMLPLKHFHSPSSLDSRGIADER